MEINVINQKFRDLAQIKRIIEEAEAEKKALEDEIKAVMEAEGTDTIIGTEHKATYKEITQRRFDSAAFKKDNEELYEAYRLPKSQMRFNFA